MERKRFVQRLDRLEARLRPKTPRSLGPVLWERLLRVEGSGDPGAARHALEDLPTWQALVPTMDAEHVAIVLDVFATEDWVREWTGRCNLALTVYHALSRVWDGPLALPKAVADVYLSYPTPCRSTDARSAVTGFPRTSDRVPSSAKSTLWNARSAAGGSAGS